MCRAVELLMRKVGLVLPPSGLFHLRCLPCHARRVRHAIPSEAKETAMRWDSQYEAYGKAHDPFLQWARADEAPCQTSSARFAPQLAACWRGNSH